MPHLLIFQKGITATPFLPEQVCETCRDPMTRQKYTGIIIDTGIRSMVKIQVKPQCQEERNRCILPSQVLKIRTKKVAVNKAGCLYSGIFPCVWNWKQHSKNYSFLDEKHINITDKYFSNSLTTTAYWLDVFGVFRVDSGETKGPRTLGMCANIWSAYNLYL